MDDLSFESAYWGDCTNTFDEEQKHFVYARLMGIPSQHYSFDAQNKVVLDIGGGPVSMLLKCRNLRDGTVIDPLAWPGWVVERYQTKGIDFVQLPGEELKGTGWDEVWIYNVLQHTVDPRLIIENAKRAAPVLRLFEWIDLPPHDGHPHMLTAAALRDWIGTEHGVVTELAESGCFGRAFSGVFVHGR